MLYFKEIKLRILFLYFYNSLDRICNKLYQKLNIFEVIFEYFQFFYLFYLLFTSFVLKILLFNQNLSPISLY